MLVDAALRNTIKDLAVAHAVKQVSNLKHETQRRRGRGDFGLAPGVLLYQPALTLTLYRNDSVSSSSGSTRGSAGTEIVPCLRVRGLHRAMPGSGPGMTDR